MAMTIAIRIMMTRDRHNIANHITHNENNDEDTTMIINKTIHTYNDEELKIQNTRFRIILIISMRVLLNNTTEGRICKE